MYHRCRDMDADFTILKAPRVGTSLDNRTVGRVLAVLELVATSPASLRLTDVARQLRLPYSSTHALLKALVQGAYLRMDEEGKGFRAGPALVSLAFRTTQGLSPVALARPLLLELMHATGEDVYLAVRIHGGIAYADQVFARRTARVAIELGTPRPLHSTAVGKLYLANLQDRELESVIASLPMPQLTPATITKADELRAKVVEARGQGYALNAEESIEGVVALAVPFVDGSESFRGAVVVSCPKHRFEPQLERFLDLTTDCAARISEALGAEDGSIGRRTNAW